MGREHVVKRIVERAQIGIDLLLHVAWKETEALAGFHGGARQDDAIDLAGGERGGGGGDGEIGLAGSGGARAQDELVTTQGLHVGPLHGRARRHDLALGPDGGLVARCTLGGLDHANSAIDVAGADILPEPGAGIEPLEDLRRLLARRRGAANGDAIAARRDVDAEAGLDQGEMLVVLAEKERQKAIVVECERHARR